jgi:hypothetical protein
VADSVRSRVRRWVERSPGFVNVITRPPLRIGHSDSNKYFGVEHEGGGATRCLHDASTKGALRSRRSGGSAGRRHPRPGTSSFAARAVEPTDELAGLVVSSRNTERASSQARGSATGRRPNGLRRARHLPARARVMASAVADQTRGLRGMTHTTHVEVQAACPRSSLRGVSRPFREAPVPLRRERRTTLRVRRVGAKLIVRSPVIGGSGSAHSPASRSRWTVPPRNFRARRRRRRIGSGSETRRRYLCGTSALLLCAKPPQVREEGRQEQNPPGTTEPRARGESSIVEHGRHFTKCSLHTGSLLHRCQ